MVSTENDFRDFVGKFEWTFAKTYAKKAPHEYLALDKVGLKHKAEFVAVARFIREAGFEACYYRRKGYYLILDDNYYWTMDEKIEDTDLINRARLSDYELVNNSWRWKGSQ